MLIESPLALARVELPPGAIPLLAPLLDGGRVRTREQRRVRDLLDAAGLLTARTAPGRTAEDRDPALVTWEFADLLFHARSRLGRHDGPAGATFAQAGWLPPPPALKPTAGHAAVGLPHPDLKRLLRRDPPLTRVLEERRSQRRPRRALRLAELGEFLFRVARVRSRRPATAGRPYAITSRPYPSGGACYPLELYPVVTRCTGLPAGIYHYDPLRHRLLPVLTSREAAAALLRDTRVETGSAPPVLLVLTARFGRVAWKYRAMAYSTVLKDVGVLMQTMYLVATAMGLSPCAVGCGDADKSARLLGTRFEAESSVGEFLLGGPPRVRGVRRGPR